MSLFLATVGAAFRQAWSLKAQAAAFTQLEQLGSRLLEQIRYQQLPLTQAILACGQSQTFSQLPFFHPWEQAMAQGDSPRAALEEALTQTGFFPAAGDLLLSLFDRLGKSDDQEQVALLQIWLRQVAVQKEAYCTKSRESGRLWMQLGIFGGLFLWIMLM